MEQTYELKSVRTSAILTNAYVAGTVLKDCENKNQLILYVDFTLGSLTSVSLKIEFSPDGDNYYQESLGTILANDITEAGVTHTLTATGKVAIALPIKCSYIKVSAIGTGTVTNSLLAIDAVVAIA